MKTSQATLIATPQFDSGRWKLRLERVPVSADNQTKESPVSSVAAGFTIFTPLIFLAVVYLCARIVG